MLTDSEMLLCSSGQASPVETEPEPGYPRGCEEVAPVAASQVRVFWYELVRSLQQARWGGELPIRTAVLPLCAVSSNTMSGRFKEFNRHS